MKDENLPDPWIIRIKKNERKKSEKEIVKDLHTNTKKLIDLLKKSGNDKEIHCLIEEMLSIKDLKCVDEEEFNKAMKLKDINLIRDEILHELETKKNERSEKTKCFKMFLNLL